MEFSSVIGSGWFNYADWRLIAAGVLVVGSIAIIPGVTKRSGKMTHVRTCVSAASMMLLRRKYEDSGLLFRVGIHRRLSEAELADLAERHRIAAHELFRAHPLLRERADCDAYLDDLVAFRNGKRALPPDPPRVGEILRSIAS